MIDFSLPDDLAKLQTRTRDFIREVVIPQEHDPRQDRHGPSDELRLELVAEGRAAGLLSPHAPAAWGGLGLDHRGRAIVLEEAGYSPIGPLALNVQPPDEGNTNLLEQVANNEQKERYLRPLVSGEQRSAFLMTEPDGGAGSDPSLMKTTARADGRGGYVINGRKWLVTGFPGAAFLIVMARTLDEDGNDLGASMFVFENGRDGVNMVGQMNTMDNNSPGGHATVDLDDVRVAGDEVLGEIGRGFRYAQVRLGPARTTHCMRWLGAARRCHDIAVGYARERQAFGKRLADHEGVGFMLADNEMDLQASRLSLWYACWLLDQGEQARNETSMAKVVCSEALGRVVDRSLQILGGKGISDETVVER
ncbi:MAG: acyl-CoA dehydrogenase, partial [Marmoricola sp.]|nr:acyl-CoA dehydrogenase [Marmoricola sp.]